MPLFNEEYDEEEDILLCGLPYPLFGPRKNDDESNIQCRFSAGLQKNDDGFAICRMNEKDMLAGIQYKNNESKSMKEQRRMTINKKLNKFRMQVNRQHVKLARKKQLQQAGVVILKEEEAPCWCQDIQMVEEDKDEEACHDAECHWRT